MILAVLRGELVQPDSRKRCRQSSQIQKWVLSKGRGRREFALMSVLCCMSGPWAKLSTGSCLWFPNNNALRGALWTWKALHNKSLGRCLGLLSHISLQRAKPAGCWGFCPWNKAKGFRAKLVLKEKHIREAVLDQLHDITHPWTLTRQHKSRANSQGHLPGSLSSPWPFTADHVTSSASFSTHFCLSSYQYFCLSAKNNTERKQRNFWWIIPIIVSAESPPEIPYSCNKCSINS